MSFTRRSLEARWKLASIDDPGSKSVTNTTFRFLLSAFMQNCERCRRALHPLVALLCVQSHLKRLAETTTTSTAGLILIQRQNCKPTLMLLFMHSAVDACPASVGFYRALGC